MHAPAAAPCLELEDVALGYGGRALISGLSLQLGTGEIGCLLGVSGCGKTTLMRAIAGFEPVQGGTIRITGEPVSRPGQGLAPERRGVGMVFQDCALFPHLDTAGNIAFGLGHVGGATDDPRVRRWARLLGLEELLGQYPHQLSGGQQQRVALARALAPEPRLLLLDEPFANLDEAAREQLARSLRRLLKEKGITALVVSHDQQDAFAIADRLGVLKDGGLLQWDTPFAIYHRPRHLYVATFIGEGCFLHGRVADECSVDTSLGRIADAQPHGYAPGREVQVLIRPDDIIHDDDSKRTAVVVDKTFRGSHFLYTLALDDGERIYSLVPSHHDHPLQEPIGIRLEIDHLVVFP